MASLLIDLKNGLLQLMSVLTIMFLTSCLVLPGYGLRPVSSMQVMTPMLQTSTFSLQVILTYLFSPMRMISGAMYNGLPRTRSRPFSGSKKHEKPKSAIFTLKLSTSFDSRRMFSGFRSRCVMFQLCMQLIANKIWLTITAAFDSLNC